MEYVIAILGLGLACGAWALLQRWIARMDPEVGNHPCCGGGCSSTRLREIDDGIEPR